MMMMITLIAIAEKISNALSLDHIQLKVEKAIIKNQNGFRRYRYITSKVLTIA